MRVLPVGAKGGQFNAYFTAFGGSSINPEGRIKFKFPMRAAKSLESAILFGSAQLNT
jgi:hypothetical protein